MTITYEVGNSLYVNITNRCPNACEFCVRTHGSSYGTAESLWLDREPSVQEIIEDIEKRDLSRYKELVFCGYGEPLERIDELCAVSRALKERHPSLKIRVNTNGLSDLIHGRKTAPQLKGLVDVLSISLNSATPEDYDRICHPKFGLKAHPALLQFAKEAKAYVPRVVLSVVDTIGEEEIEKCRVLAETAGTEFRVRKYIP